MRRILTYTGLQCRRIARYAPFVLGITLLLCLCLALVLTVVVSTESAEADKQKFSVGVVGDFSDSYLNLGVTALKSLDASRFTFEIVELTLEQAEQKLQSGELMAYVVIPDGFVEDAMYGDVNKLTYVTKQTGLDMGTLFKDEVLALISCMLVESQNGIYSMQNVMHQYGISGIMDHTYVAMAEYLSLILNRDMALEQQIIGVSDSVSFGGYMFSGVTVLLLLLCGIAYCPVFSRRDRSLMVLLNANRCGAGYQILGEFAAFFGMALINSALLFAVLMVGAADAVALIPELAGCTPGGVAALFVRFVPAIFALTALQFLLYELTDSVVSGVLLQFLCAIGLAYISGCLYPIGFFPKSIQALSVVTPSGIARGYLSSLLSGEGQLWTAAALAGYACVLLLVAGFARRRRIQRG